MKTKSTKTGSTQEAKTPLEQLEEFAKSKTPKFYLKDWTEKEHKKVNSALCLYFGDKVFINHRNENVLFGYDLERIETILGLPYVSRSSFPMLVMDCNTNIKYHQNTDFYYQYVAIDKTGNVILGLTDKEENEMFIKI